MITLGLDSTGPYCSVSLVNDAQVLAHLSERINRGHAERLAPMVADALRTANCAPQDIARIAVCTGPGSFTGQRVALSFAKGFALPRATPVIGLSALQACAAQADPAQSQNIIAVQDVRRGQLCWAQFVGGVCTHAPITQNTAAAQAEIAARAPDRVVRDGTVDTRILAWLGAGCDPMVYHATPLYSRGPDAKLPSPKKIRGKSA